VKQSRSIERALSTLLLPIALTLSLGFSSWAQSNPVRRVAVLTPGETFGPVFHGLQEGLTRLGYTEGKNIAFAVEDTKGSTSDLAPRAQKLLTAKPDALFAVTTAHALAAKQATTTVPVVFALVSDPVQAGLVASFASSKNNLTGATTGADSLSGKRLELLLNVAPKAKRLLVIVALKERIALSSFRFLEESAKKLGVQLVRRDVATEEEIKKALRDTPKGSVDAIYFIPSTFVRSHVSLLTEKAKADKIPMVSHDDAIVEQGALLSYGPTLRSAGVQAARLIAKVLKGEKPAEIPSEGPDKLMLAVNLKTAKEIGLKIPPTVLERADRLVE
jgi:putative ABC transport system substrate-binding protein